MVSVKTTSDFYTELKILFYPFFETEPVKKSSSNGKVDKLNKNIYQRKKIHKLSKIKN